MTKPDAYQRWWKGKYLEDGRQITDVVFHGPPSGVYGMVELVLDDGSYMFAPMGHTAFLPRKRDLVVFDEKPEVPR